MSENDGTQSGASSEDDSLNHAGDDSRIEIVSSANWSGPLPPPSYLAEFESILPGAAERVFKQFENEGHHRRALAEADSRFVARDAAIGQVLAGIYAIAAFSLTGFAIYMNATWVAAILGSGTIVSGIVAFLRRSK